MARQYPLQSAFVHAMLATFWQLGGFSASVACAQKIVAHRGASHDAPENTLAAFKLAWQQGADAIEGDFYLTSDQEIVCIHDKDTKRVSAENLVVAETPLAKLRTLDVGTWKSPVFADERIPTLSEVLQTVPLGKQIFIEIKCGPEIVPVLQRTLKDCPLEPQQLVVISFNRDVIHATKELLPNLKTYWVSSLKENQDTGETIPPSTDLVDQAVALGADGLDLKVPLKDRGRLAQLFSPAFLKRLARAKLELHGWTIDDSQLAQEAAKLGFRSITTNQPALIRQALQPAEAAPAVDGE